MAIVADFDPTTPSIARVYDYLLDGKDNFAVDREVAQRLMAVAPLTVDVTRENRQFLARAVTWAANQGITQFIDLGCGLPTAPNTHETAQAIAAGIDLSAPACLLMGFLLHFFAPDAARDLVARYAAALAPGSYVVLSVGRADAEAAKAGFSTYSSGAAQVYNHSVPDFVSFFGALELVPPGAVDAREWRPDWEQAVHLRPRDGQAIVGVARVG